jgi:hypothetical protein
MRIKSTKDPVNRGSVIVTPSGAQRGGDRGDRGDKVTGPQQALGVAREDQIMHIKWGPGKAKSGAPEGPRKVVYVHDPAVFQL